MDEMTAKTENINSEKNEAEAFLHLKKLQIRSLVIDTIIIVVVSVMGAIAVYANTTRQVNRIVRQQDCIVDGFLLPPDQIANAEKKCR